MSGWMIGGVLWLALAFGVSWLWGSLARFPGGEEEPDGQGEERG